MPRLSFVIPEILKKSNIALGEARYKLSTSNVWIVFTIEDLNNPQTPEVLEEGIYNIQVRVIYGRATGEDEGWQPTRELDNNRNSNTNFSPFSKSFADKPSYVLQESKIRFYVNNFICSEAKITYLEQPTLITEDQVLNMPFVNELQDETVTLILENLESRRVQTQPPISKQ
jgi:hypothetical protein